MTKNVTGIRFFVLAVILVLLVAACGGDGSDDETQEIIDEILDSDAADEEEPEVVEEEPEVVEEEPEVVEEEPEVVEEEPEPEPEPELVRGVIEESFVGAPAVPYSVDLVVAGDVKVYFNNGTSGFIVAIFHGSGMTDPTGLCPGSSLFAGSFQFVSNAPAAVDACDGFTTDVSSVRVCTSAVWLLQTKIPNDSVGDVYGSLEKIVDGDFVGMTAVATNSPGTPPIDFNADVHTIPSMFTIDGSAEISCDAALT